MSKLTKQDFDSFLGKPPYYSTEDKTRFFKNLEKKQSEKQRMPQILTVVLIAGLLFFGIQLIQQESSLLGHNANPNGPHFGIEWKEASSMEEVEKYYEEKTPGLIRAEELGLVTEVDKQFKLKEGYDLYIDKVWYNSDEIFIFYSIGLPDKDVLEEAEATPEIIDFNLRGDSDGQFPEQSLELYTKNFTTRDGIVYNNRIYHRATTTQIKDMNDQPILNIDKSVNLDIAVRMPDYDQIELENVQLPIKFNRTKEPVYYQHIKQLIEEENINIGIINMDLGLTKNIVYGSVQSKDGSQLNKIQATITTDTGEELNAIGYIPDDEQPDEFILETPPLNNVPGELTFTVEEVHLAGNDSFEFSLDVSDYEEKLAGQESYRVTVHEKIAEIMSTAIYLESLYYDERGIDFTILYESANADQKFRLIADAPQEANLYTNNFKYPLIVTAANENGEPGIFGQRGSGPDNQFDMFLDKEFITASKRVDIKVENLLYSIKVDKSITFPINAN